MINGSNMLHRKSSSQQWVTAPHTQGRGVPQVLYVTNHPVTGLVAFMAFKVAATNNLYTQTLQPQFTIVGPDTQPVLNQQLASECGTGTQLCMAGWKLCLASMHQDHT